MQVAMVQDAKNVVSLFRVYVRLISVCTRSWSPYDSVWVHICTKIHNSTQHELLCSSGFVLMDVCGLHTLLRAWQEFSRRDWYSKANCSRWGNVCSQSETVILGLNKYCKRTYPAAQCDRALNWGNNIHQTNWGYLLWSLQTVEKADSAVMWGRSVDQSGHVSIKAAWYFWQHRMEGWRWKLNANLTIVKINVAVFHMKIQPLHLTTK